MSKLREVLYGGRFAWVALAAAALQWLVFVRPCPGDDSVCDANFKYVKKATWEETFAASLAASSVTAPVLGEWFYIGPFDNTGGIGFDTVYPPEKGVELDRAYEGKGGRLVRWKRAETFVDGRVNDLKGLFPDNTHAVVYLYRTIYSPADMECIASLGSDDTLTVWLNNLKLLAKNVSRAAAADQDRVKLPLRKGRNDLLLKICQGGGEWTFYFSLDTKIPPEIEEPLLKRLIRDFPTDRRVDEAYQRLYAVRLAKSQRAETAAPDLLGINLKAFGASGVGAPTNGTVDAGSRIVTNVADTATFKPGQGVYLWHFTPVDGLAVLDAGKSDYVATVKVLPRPGSNPSEPGLAFRATDAKNYWALSACFASASASKALVRLVKVRDGAATELRAKEIERPSSPTAPLNLKVALKGNKISALVNDRAIFELEDPFNAGAKLVGLYQNAHHLAGSPLYLEFRVGSAVYDDFDRPNNRYSLGSTADGGRKWEALAGRWGIVGGCARRTEGARGESLATVVVEVGEDRIELAEPWEGEDNALVEIYHDDTAAVERALGIRPGGGVARSRHLVFPGGGYNISHPLRLGPYVRLTGLDGNGGLGASINALPGFAPDFDDEKFLLHWCYADLSDSSENYRQGLENLRLAAIHPETNPGLSGIRLATGPGSRYTDLDVDVPQRGIVIADGSAGSLFENLRVRAGRACIDILGNGTETITFLNVALGLYDIGLPSVGLRIGQGARGIVAEGVISKGPARPILVQGGNDLCFLGLNATGRPDYPVIEVERSDEGLNLSASGIARNCRKAVVVGGETVAWAGTPNQGQGPRSFCFSSGQSAIWMAAPDGLSQANYFAETRPTVEIQGGDSLVVDLIDTRTCGGGCLAYDYVASTCGPQKTVEVGSLTLIHNLDEFQLVRTVKGRIGPDSGKPLFTPDATMRDGLLALKIRADVRDDEAIRFGAVKRGLGLPGPVLKEIGIGVGVGQPVAPGALAPSRPGADGYIRDWLVLGPAPYYGDTPRGVLSHDDLGGEGSIKPRPGRLVVVRGKRLVWTPAHSDSPILDLNRLFSPDRWTSINRAFAYMVAYLRADRELPNLALHLDFDDAVRVWLNGSEIKYNRDADALGTGEKVLRHHGVKEGLALKKGENVLVLKICNETGRWAVGVRFENLEGRPVQDFLVAAGPQEK